MPFGGALAKLRGAVEKVATEKAKSDGKSLPSFMRPTAAAAQNQNKQKFEYKVRPARTFGKAQNKINRRPLSSPSLSSPQTTLHHLSLGGIPPVVCNPYSLASSPPPPQS